MVPGLTAARAAFVTAIRNAEALQQRQPQRLAPVLERRDAADGENPVGSTSATSLSASPTPELEMKAAA